MNNDLNQKIAALEKEIHALDTKRASLQRQLNDLKSLKSPTSSAPVTQLSSNAEKIRLFRELFKGREDVYPRRWENSKTGKSGYSPVCGNEWKKGICDKPRVKCSACQHKAFLPVTDLVIQSHLSGTDYHSNTDFVMGVYPMLPDERCWFVAVDFDKAQWQSDVQAFSRICQQKQVPHAIEISRSGQGAHIWVFFTQAIFAVEARKLAALLLTQAMAEYPEIGFDSYDRFFPNQDTLPKGGFGNLIALPLQKKARDQKNSVFVDEHFKPYEDQWAFLSTLKRLSPIETRQLIEQAESNGDLLGVRMPVAEDDGEPWTLPPSRKTQITIQSDKLPASLHVTQASQLFIEKQNLPPSLQNKIIRLAAFQNPEFYKAQAMRLPTFDKPRIIACAENYSQHIAIPRGCLEELLSLCKELNVQVDLQDERFAGNKIEDLHFQGELLPEQQTVVDCLLQHDTGTLSATTAFGKTVIALYLLARRQVNTLIIVHRRQLLDQWLERIAQFLTIDQKKVGRIGGGKRKPTGIIDVAVMQSLFRQQQIDDVVANYGQVIFDECHHLSAVNFENVAKACKAKYVLGLSATLVRKDGHHPIVTMQCGPVRYKVDAKKQAIARPFEHRLVFRDTEFILPSTEDVDSHLAIHQIYQALIQDEKRNQLIIDDVEKLLQEGRSPLVLTERKQHVSVLAERIRTFVKHVVVLQGGETTKQRKSIQSTLDNIPEQEERVLIATGRYLEGVVKPQFL